jgi:GTP-binding protein
VLTKTDKVKKEELEKTMLAIEKALKKHPAAFPEMLATSAHKAINIDILRAIAAQQAL